MDLERNETEHTFFQRHRWMLVGTILLAIAGIAGVAIYLSRQSDSAPKKPKPPPVVAIQLPPPPPPPPPPPKPEKEPEEKEMIEPPDEPEPEPEPTPQDEPPPATGITGDGDNSFGLSTKGGNGIFGGQGGSSSSRGWSRYAAQVQASIAEAIRRHPETQRSVFSIKVKVWIDSTGKLDRASLDGTTGDPNLDAILSEKILSGLRLSSVPPDDLPMPIVMRLTAQRPR